MYGDSSGAAPWRPGPSPYSLARSRTCWRSATVPASWDSTTAISLRDPAAWEASTPSWRVARSSAHDATVWCSRRGTPPVDSNNPAGTSETASAESR